MGRWSVSRKTPVVFLSLLSSFFFLLFAFCFIPDQCWGEGPTRITLEATSPQKLSLVVGKSVIIRSTGAVKRVSLGATEIADALVLTARQISLTGKAPGVTNLTLWGLDNRVSAILDLEVSPDISRLMEMIAKILPEEKDIRVMATHDNITLSGAVSSLNNYEQIVKLSEPFSPKKVVNLMKIKEEISPISKLKEMIHQILPEEKDVMVTTAHNNITLSGTVSSTSNLSQVLKLAESYLPKDGKVVNLLEVGGVHQVMLEVRVAEMSRSLLKRLGVNFAYVAKDGLKSVLGISLLGRLASGASETGVPVSGLSDSITGIFRFVNKDTTWTGFIDALKEQGLIKLLAEPTLITLSGKTGNFLAGGEFPIPVPDQDGRVTIQYKPFGVGLAFTPTVLSNKKISMQVAPEVSDLDFSRALTIGGFVVPSLTTRRVSTVIELGDGQSFAIAGLLKEDIREVISKFPILGEIPVLGALFRSTNFQKNETELIIIVTPHLVKPLDMAKQTLPTDQFIEPDDFEFYLLGNLEGKEKTKPSAPVPKPSSSKTHGLEGSFGHIVPK